MPTNTGRRRQISSKIQGKIRDPPERRSLDFESQTAFVDSHRCVSNRAASGDPPGSPGAFLDTSFPSQIHWVRSLAPNPGGKHGRSQDRSEEDEEARSEEEDGSQD